MRSLDEPINRAFDNSKPAFFQDKPESQSIMSIDTTQDYVAFLGIDWASKSHAMSLQSASGDQWEDATISSCPKRVDQFIAELKERFGNGPIAVGVEMSKGALIDQLQTHDCFDIYPINPATSTRYRKAFTPSGAKDDLPDARLHRDLIRLHRERFRVLQPVSDADRRLDTLTKARRKLCDHRKELENKLRNNLKDYYPLALEVAGELKKPMGCAFLLKWPDQPSLLRARRTTIESFYRKAGSRSSHRIAERLEMIEAATVLTDNPAINEPMAAYTISLVRQITVLNEEIAKFDKQIAEVYAEHPDADLWKSFPGSGSVMAPRLAAAWTMDRSRFCEARAMQLYSAIAPVRENSGESEWIHRRWSKPQFLHQTFWEYAHHSVHHCRWANAFVASQMAKGKKRSTALRALAFKWQRIMFRCWQDEKPYDDEAYEEQLRKRNSPFAEPKKEIKKSGSPEVAGGETSAQNSQNP